jgi:signal transduction histidine kinase
LGLYICSQIVDGHGGRIWADSRGLGYGSSFCFTLPRESTNSSSDSSGDSLPDRHEG